MHKFKTTNAARGLLLYDGVIYGLLQILIAHPKAQGHTLAFLRTAINNPTTSPNNPLANADILAVLKPGLKGVEKLIENVLGIKPTPPPQEETPAIEEDGDSEDSDDDPGLF